MVANTVEEFNPRDFSTCSTPRFVHHISIKIFEKKKYRVRGKNGAIHT